MELCEGNTVGIDLGTAYSTLAYLDDDGNPTVVRNAGGSELTSSVIVLGSDGKAHIGPKDLSMAENPNCVIMAIKRQMGNSNYFTMYRGRRLNAEFLSALILKKLKQDAERQIGPVANAVITVPHYFNDPKRKATLNAGRIAGLNVLDIINEPTAATLAYAWSTGELGRKEVLRAERTVLVYDLGGGTLDVTVVKYSPVHFTVVATDGDTFLGGLDWTNRIVDYVAERFQRAYHIDPRDDPHVHLGLFDRCDAAKRTLSTEQETFVRVAHEGHSLSVRLKRTEFEKMTADLLQRTQDTTEIVLNDAGVHAVDLDEILLVGGSTYMPMVAEMILNLCGQYPSAVLNPQLAVAQGAAIHAAILEARHSGGSGRMAEAVNRRLKSVTKTDVNSHSLGVELTDKYDPSRKHNHIMIPRNSRLPYEAQQRFVTNLANPQGIRIRLLEGEVSNVDACTTVGDFRVANLPQDLPAGSPVEVTYRYDARRHIHVTARELTGNSQASVEIVWESGLNNHDLNVFQRLAEEYHVE
jgi:molecular chaperone DnaK